MKKMNHHRIRSYVPRGRRTPAQERAYVKLWPQFGLSIEDGLLDSQQVFGCSLHTTLEIGFGSGQSLVALAKLKPECHFIGVETHQPGIGALLMGVEENQLTNVRVYYNDVVDVLEQCIPLASLDNVQIFFPDPWQKRRHHERRLIQPEFIALVVSRLKVGGTLQLATDWEDYAKEMKQVILAETQLSNLMTERCSGRPIMTKFEKRALREGRSIWDMAVIKV